MTTITISRATMDGIGETDGVDIDASCEKLDELTIAAVQAAYPDATVEFGGDTLRVYPDDCDDDGATYNHVSDILNCVFDNGEWAVSA